MDHNSPENSTDQRIYRLKLITALALFVSLIMSRPLWLSGRSYPLSPIFSSLPAIPYPFDQALYLSVLALIMAIVFFPSSNRYLVATVSLLGWLAMFDQSRWQPWVFQYFLILTVLALSTGRATVTDRPVQILNCCRLIIAAIYFWSGVQKLNINFATGVFPWLLEPVIELLPARFQELPATIGLGAALLESSIGLGLLFNSTRRVAVVFACLLHSTVLVLLGPFGHRFNSIIWIWNMTLAGSVLILFARVGKTQFGELFISRKFAIESALVVFVGLMPVFSFFNLWDSYPSWALYSGRSLSAMIFVSEELRGRMPPQMRQSIWPETEMQAVSIFDWSMREMNVPPYPEKRVYLNIARQVCAYAREDKEVRLSIEERPDRISGVSQIVNCHCAEIKHGCP